MLIFKCERIWLLNLEDEAFTLGMHAEIFIGEMKCVVFTIV